MTGVVDFITAVHDGEGAGFATVCAAFWRAPGTGASCSVLGWPCVRIELVPQA